MFYCYIHVPFSKTQSTHFGSKKSSSTNSFDLSRSATYAGYVAVFMV